MKKHLFILILTVLFICGCQTAQFRAKAPLENEGEVYLYIRPFPQEAERLNFSVEGISAIGEGGIEYPLSLNLSEFSNKEINRQRLVATGVLPPGPYSGLSFKVKKARLRTEEGDADLLVPAKPAPVTFPFRVEKKKALLISMQFRYGESLQGGFSFSPSFSMLIPDRPLISLMGFISNYGSNSVLIFDKRAAEVSGVIATGSGPMGMAINPGRGRVYTALSGADAVEEIDMSSADIINTIKLNPGDKPRELALTPDGRVLLSANYGSNTVSFIDAGSSIETDRVQVGDGPKSIAIDQTGRRAFVFNSNASTISVIDIPSRSVAATLATDPNPTRGQFNRRGDRLYVINSGSPYLVILDPATFALIRREFVGMGMNSIKVDTRTDLIYTGKRFDTELAVYDPTALVPIDYVRARAPVGFISIDGEGNNLLLVTPDKRLLSIVNIISKKDLGDLDVGDEPYWVTVQGER